MPCLRCDHCGGPLVEVREFHFPDQEGGELFWLYRCCSCGETYVFGSETQDEGAI